MLYLLLAVLSSASISVLMRLFEGRVKNTMAMFAGNYALCSLLSLAYMGQAPLGAEGRNIALLLGVLSGVFFLAAFLLLQKSITVNGVALSSTFMKMGVLVPTLTAVVLFGEKLTGSKHAGFLLALAAIVLLKLEKGEAGTGKHFVMLLGLLLVGGTADVFAALFNRFGTQAYADMFLLLTFLTALALSGLGVLPQRKTAAWKDLLYGALVGLPNYYSTRFLLKALGKLPAVTVYPVYSVSVLMLTTLMGVLLFKERLNARKLTAFALILAALLLLNLRA